MMWATRCGAEPRSDEDTNRMAASFSLIIEDDAGRQIVVPFTKDVITIGRKEGNTIRLTERNVSRFHAKLSKEDNHILVEDIKSFNGVKLNGDRIAGRVQVAAGDVIEIGDYHIELRSALPAATKLGPAGAKSGAVPVADTAGGDDFEGDTQRWEPPAGGPVLPVGGSPTQESPHAGGFGDNSGDTERLDLGKLPPLGGHITTQQAWPPPQRSAPPPIVGAEARDLEPTVRQPASPGPVGGMVPAPPPPTPPTPAPPAPAPPAPSWSAPAPPVSNPQALPYSAPVPQPSALEAELPLVELEPLHDATKEMPLPAAQARVAATPAKRDSEHTEQLRPAPRGNPAEDVSVPRLVVLNTIFAGSSLPLRAPENVLGRTDDNDIILEHRSVSRNHAKLVREGERVRILDLKSANGVLVNGEEVEQHVLRAGDVIELGRVRMRFVPAGERFSVPPDEIERARIADAAGDDVEEPSKTLNVTSPLRLRDLPVSTGSKPLVLYGVVAVLLIVVVILLVVVLGGADHPVVGDAPGDRSGTAASPSSPSSPSSSAPQGEPSAKTVAAVATLPDSAAAPPAEAVVPAELPAAGGASVIPAKKATTKPAIDVAKLTEEAQRNLLRREYGQAVKVLETIVERSPNDTRAHLNLGISYAQLRKVAKAREHYQRFLQLQPTGREADSVRESLKNL
jgi:pSer/pThr/pTyr-binding forkhead associated (FHA) protein